MAALLALLLAFPTPAADAAAPHVVFVTGDEEYRSEESMPLLASLLRTHHGLRCTVCYATDERGFIAPSKLDHIGNLDALATADLVVMFTRYRALPEAELNTILAHAKAGRPLVGFRTTTHAFKYPAGSPFEKWNDGWGRDVFGQKWIVHHGHEKGDKLTAVAPLASAAGHPILRGVTAFRVPSWLYHVQGGGDALAGDCTPLADGTSIVSKWEREGKLDRYPKVQPVAWTKTQTLGPTPARVFFTTLGHPHDFAEPAMRTLALNGVLWALGREAGIPAGGAKADLVEPFALRTAGVGGHAKGVPAK